MTLCGVRAAEQTITSLFISSLFKNELCHVICTFLHGHLWLVWMQGTKNHMDLNPKGDFSSAHAALSAPSHSGKKSGINQRIQKILL
jgi:hypothetical protein